jgi:pyroglutamyl-peptidase
MAVLVYGFEPFLEFDENPSQLIAQSLDGREIGGAKIVGVSLPVDYGRIEHAIKTSIEKTRPELVIGFGLAPRRDSITPEKIAANYRFSEEPDNTGKRMNGIPIDESQPDGLFTNMQVESLVASLRSLGIPASLSLSAGAYLCNNAMFVIVREARRHGFVGGFVHVPCHSEWAASKNKQLPSLPLATIKRAAEHCVEYSLRDRERAKDYASNRV